MHVIGNTKFYTTNEVATTLGVKEATVRSYIRDGFLVAAKVGRAYMVSDANLRDYVGKKFQISPTEI